MATLPKRDELIRRHAQDVQKEVQEALTRLAAALNASTALPLTLDCGVIGNNPAVQNEVVRVAREYGYAIRQVEQQWEVR